jgi:hypothetical protein
VLVKLVQASREHVEPIASVLARAFAADPVFAWLLPAKAGRESRLRRFFSLELSEVVLIDGWAQTSESLDGAALCLPPGAWRLPAGRAAANGRSFLRTFGARLPWATGLLWRMESVHPREPHYYLEATNERNASLYDRLGFEHLRELRFAGPPLLLMQRNPGAAG